MACDFRPLDADDLGNSIPRVDGEFRTEVEEVDKNFPFEILVNQAWRVGNDKELRWRGQSTAGKDEAAIPLGKTDGNASRDLRSAIFVEIEGLFECGTKVGGCTF